MSGDEKDVWFPAKKYGWGWGLPITWQGWVILMAYLLLLLGGIQQAESDPTLSGSAMTLYFIGITAVFVGICWIKGEKPRR